MRALAILLLLPAPVLAAPPGGLRLEDRAAENVIRISNPSRRAVTVFYNYAGSFGDYQMLKIRFRDGAGRIVGLDGGHGDGWWTPLVNDSNLYRPGHVPRRSLTVAAGDVYDMPRDIGALTAWLRMGEVRVAGPCQIQLMLATYPDRRSSARREVTSEWQPADCPR